MSTRSRLVAYTRREFQAFLASGAMAPKDKMEAAAFYKWMADARPEMHERMLPDHTGFYDKLDFYCWALGIPR